MLKRQELEQRKDVGNNFMKNGQYGLARDIYFSILVDIDTRSQSEISLDDFNDIKLACFNNLSAVYFQHDNFTEVIKLTTKALSISPNNVKALYRQAQAYEKLNLISLAMSNISSLLEIEPNNKQGKEYFDKLFQLKSHEPEKEKENETEDAKEGVAEEEKVEIQPPPPPPVPIQQLEMQQEEVKQQEMQEEQNEAIKPHHESYQSMEYGFMNTSWHPSSSSTTTATTSSFPTLPTPPLSSASNSSTNLTNISNSLQSELEKNKIKSTIFQSALLSLQSSSSTSSSITPSHNSSSQHNSNPTNENIQTIFSELKQNEEQLQITQQQKTKPRNTIATNTTSSTSTGKKKDTSGSLKTKKVISKTADEEWKKLLTEERVMKEQVEEKQQYKRRSKNNEKKSNK